MYWSWWLVGSVHGISEFEGAELIREEKPGLDVKYVKTPSLLTDIRIIPVTVAKAFR